MNGHISNRYLLVHFKAVYQQAKKDRDRRDTPEEEIEREFFEGRMAQAVESAILLDLIESEGELEDVLL